MALAFADRVKETTTTTGTGTITLAGASAGYQSFAAIGNGNTTYYTIAAGTEWEVGIGTYTAAGTTLSRDTVLASSNGGALVNFSAGVKDVFCDYPAGKAVIQDGSTIKAGTAVLAVPNGGTGAATLTTNGVIYGNGTSALAVTAAGTTGQVLVGNTGGAPSWATLSGIGVTSFSAGTTGLTPSTGTTGAVTLAGTLGVANGGTGQTSLTAGYVLKGSGTSAIASGIIYDNGTNVGIGTASPASKLDVNGTTTTGNITVRGDGVEGGQITFNNLGNTAAPLTLDVDGSGSGRLFTTVNNASLIIGQLVGTGGVVTLNTAGSERMRVDAGGNVNIGAQATTAAGGLRYLDIYNIENTNSASGADIRLITQNAAGTGTTTLDLIKYKSGAFYIANAETGSGGIIGFNTSSTERMRITSAGDVGVGTTVPGGKFQSSAGTSQVAVMAGGTVNAPGYPAFGFEGQIASNGGRGAGMYLPADGTLAWSTNAIERMRITSAGNVGISTSTPSTTLDVNGSQITRGDVNGYALFVPKFGTNPFGADYDRFEVRVDPSSQVTYLGNYNGGTGAARALALVTGGSNRVYVTTAGLVGIGTSSPGYLLHGVQNGNAEFRVSATNVGTNSAGLTVENEGNRNWNLWANRSTDVFNIGANSRANSYVAINGSSGNVGIGTTSPGATLTVVTNTTAHNGMRVTNNSTTQYAGSGLQMLGPSAAGTQGGAGIYYYNTNVGGTTGALGIAQLDNNGSFQRNLAYYDYSGQYWGFLTNGSERIRINSAGDVGIGTSTPASLLHVKRGANPTEVYPAGTWAARVINATDASTEHGLLVGNRWAAAASTVFEAGSIFGGGTGSWYSYYKVDGVGQSIWSNQGTERMRLDTSGNLGIGTSSPNSRLKVYSTAANTPTIANVQHDTSGNNFDYASASVTTNSGTVGITSWASGSVRGGTGWVQTVGALPLVVGVNDTEVARFNTSGNVGIGTSSPGVRLDVAGSVRVSNTNSMQFRNAAGSGVAYFTLQSDDNFVVYNATGTPISSFTQGSTNIAVYGSNGSNRMQVDSINNVTSWTVNGSERARINSSGQFLIGTTTGGRTVCIYGSDNWMRMHNASRSWLIGPSTGTGFNIYDETAGLNRFVIDTNGTWNGYNSILLGSGQNLDNKIEIGNGRTGNNYAYIDLIGDTTYTDFGLRLLRGNGGPNTFSQLYHQGTGGFDIGTLQGGPLVFLTNGTERMRIGPSGGVAIGGTGTDATLHIQTSYGGYDRLTQIAPSVANKPAFNIMAAKNSGGSDLWWSWGVNTDNTWRINQGVGFGGNGITIESNGTATFTGLIVGRNSASTDVNSANDTGSISIRGSTTTVAAMSFHRAGAYAMNMGLGLDAVFRIGGWSAVSNAFQMDGSGNLTMAGNVTAYSDARLKKDVETIDSALDLVSKMRGVRYTRIDSGKRGVGVIAQEMLEVVPEVVQQGVGDDDTLSVAYGNLVGVLIEAVKELTARVAELEGK